MITASHLPFHRNGFKFFISEGGAEKADISAILASAAQQAQAEGVAFSGGPAHDQAAAAFVLSAALKADPSLRRTVRPPLGRLHLLSHLLAMAPAKPAP